MIVMWTIAGAIIGWIVIEFVAAFSKCRMPYLFNIGMAFVGALTAYTIATKCF